MIKRSLIVLLTIFIFSGYLSGQKPLDTLYLKNGSLIYGKLQKSRENLFIIKTPEGAIFNFNKDEVDRFISSSAVKPKEKKHSAWRFMIQGGMNIGSGRETPRLLLSVNPMLCFTKDTTIKIGLGSGFELLRGIYVPLFIDFKTDFLKKNAITPFFYMKTGLLFPLSGDEEYWNYTRNVRNGWTFGTGLGFSWPISEIESFVRIGYKYSHTSIVTVNTNLKPNKREEETENYNRIELTWELRF